MTHPNGTVAKPAFAPGDIFHQYRVVRRLGAGLHGACYLVEHVHTHARHALKVMHLEDAREASRVRRALSTAVASHRIQHANVVTVHDLGCEEDGKVWVLMEALDGGTIGELLACQRGKISVPLALHVAVETAWGLDAAHEMRIIHRDVKPENVFLTADGRVVVIDFSLAKVIPDGIPTTQRRTGFGTPPYMAPEALRGGDPDARFDVYSLGVMLWQMLAGRHPFQDAMRDTQEMIRRQLHVAPEPLSVVAKLPAYVDDFMRRAVAKDPGERFFTVAEMARAMMTLRDRLRDDAARGEIFFDVPPGEPRIGGGRTTDHAYHGTHSVIEPEPPPTPAPARVIVAETQRLPAGLGGTLPIGAVRGVPFVEPAPTPVYSAPEPQVTHPTPRGGRAPQWEPAAARPAPLRAGASAAARDVAPETTRPARRAVARRGVLVVLAAVSALLACLGVLAWRRVRPHAFEHPPAPATASAPVTTAAHPALP